jgi:hypothetical protein
MFEQIKPDRRTSRKAGFYSGISCFIYATLVLETTKAVPLPDSGNQADWGFSELYLMGKAKKQDSRVRAFQEKI